MANRQGAYIEDDDIARAAMGRLNLKIAEASIGSCCEGVWASLMDYDGHPDALTRWAQVTRLCPFCHVHLLMLLAEAS